MSGFIITEEEKKRISNLHKNYITEQVALPNIQPGVYNDKVKQLQQYLIDTYKSNIVADGKLGPKTLVAAQTALQGKTTTANSEVKTDAAATVASNTNTSSNGPEVSKDAFANVDKTTSNGTNVVPNVDAGLNPVQGLNTDKKVANSGNNNSSDYEDDQPQQFYGKSSSNSIYQQ